jgi:hypothetical protein
MSDRDHNQGRACRMIVQYLDFLVALLAEIPSTTGHFRPTHRELLSREVFLNLNLWGWRVSIVIYD